MSQTFFIAVALLIGLGLIISSVHLTPLVENSTDRAKQSVIGVQILGVAILSILGTKLTCQGSPRDFDILLSIMLVFIGVAVGLFWVIYTDCVESREFTIYALSISIGIFFTIIGLLIYIFVYKRKKTESTINYEDLYKENSVWSDSQSNDSKLDEKLEEDLQKELDGFLEEEDLKELEKDLKMTPGEEVPITFRLPSSDVEVAELKKERQKIAAERKQIKQETKKINQDEYDQTQKDFENMKGELSKKTSDDNSRRIRKLLAENFLRSEQLAEKLEKSDT